MYITIVSLSQKWLPPQLILSGTQFTKVTLTAANMDVLLCDLVLKEDSSKMIICMEIPFIIYNQTLAIPVTNKLLFHILDSVNFLGGGGGGGGGRSQEGQAGLIEQPQCNNYIYI